VHHLVAVARWHPERVDHRIMGRVQQRLDLGWRAPLDEVDLQQRHCCLPI
jgi:hypothetical protein